MSYTYQVAQSAKTREKRYSVLPVNRARTHAFFLVPFWRSRRGLGSRQLCGWRTRSIKCQTRRLSDSSHRHDEQEERSKDANGHGPVASMTARSHTVHVMSFTTIRCDWRRDLAVERTARKQRGDDAAVGEPQCVASSRDAARSNPVITNPIWATALLWLCVCVLGFCSRDGDSVHTAVLHRNQN